MRSKNHGCRAQAPRGGPGRDPLLRLEVTTILTQGVYLKKINSQYIDQTTIKTENLKETFEAFEEYGEKPYSVAWTDCLAKGDKIGRSLLMVGDFMDDGILGYLDMPERSIPFNFPTFALNKWSVRVFNYLNFRL